MAAATRWDFAALTLYIPEVTTRTFRSVVVKITARQVDAAATSLTSWLIGIKLGAVAFDDVTITGTIANSGEHSTWVFTRNVTSYFTTNFGAEASQTCQVGVLFGGVITINITAKLIITYEAEEQQTRIKTVRIPLESPVGNQPNVLTEIGTNQVPLLNTFLPESTKVYRDIFFEITANEASGAITGFQMGLSLDAEAEVLDGLHEQALISSVYYTFIWKRTDMTTSAVHAFKARATAVATLTVLNTLTVTLVVTYEYDHTASTSILNSLLLPLPTPPHRRPCNEADPNQEVIVFKFFVEEPATIALVQSAITLFLLEPNATTPRVKAGAQAYRGYTHDAGTMTCGGFSLQQRIDAGGAQGAGLTLARGENTLTVQWDTTGSVPYTTGQLVLNYTSGKHASGDGVHAHTVIVNLLAMDADSFYRNVTQAVFNIPEANYWIVALGGISAIMSFQAASYATPFGGLYAQYAAGEGPGLGYRWLDNDIPHNDGELGAFNGASDYSPAFDRYPTDPDATRMAIETSRVWRRVWSLSVWWGELLVLTYHAITKTVSGAVSGYTGDGSGIQVDIHRKDTGEKVLQATTSAGGTYSATWYDDVIPLKADARQSATLMGRSDDGLAT